jgi:hypothetical protein
MIYKKDDARDLGSKLQQRNANSNGNAHCLPLAFLAAGAGIACIASVLSVCNLIVAKGSEVNAGFFMIAGNRIDSASL